MSTGKRGVFTREFKLAAIGRVLAGEMPQTVCQNLGIRPSNLSQWCARYRRHGAEGVRRAGRPQKLLPGQDLNVSVPAEYFPSVQQQIADLQRKIGQQQVELDFFRQALRHVEEARRRTDGAGVKASMPRSGQ
jgi:transposase-like protein